MDSRRSFSNQAQSTARDTGSLIFCPRTVPSLVGRGRYWSMGRRGPCLVGTWTEGPPVRTANGLVHYRGEQRNFRLIKNYTLGA